jgi:thiosulfate/3-mercaptopyruvate sulfurtransferase
MTVWKENIMKNIVSAEWLVENLDKEGVIVLDARSELGNPSYGSDAYKEGHIEGAVYVSVEDILTGEVKKHGGRHPLPDMNEFAVNINKLGVDDKSSVIVYDDGDLSMAGRLWWMLKLIGKEDVRLLGGGIKKWIEKGYPLSKVAAYPKPGETLTVKMAPGIEASIEEVREALKDPKAVVIDSRTAERFRGEVEPIDKIAGHIPGAVNYPWTDLTEGERVPDIDELVDHFESLKEYDQLIVHCGSGITGTVNALFMEEVGLKARLYVGGWSDWITYPENEVATGM